MGTSHGDCHLPLQGLNHMLLQLPIFNTPGKEFRVESRNTLCSRKAGRTGLQTDIFRSWCYEPNSYISSYLEKHWNPSWWHLLPVTSKSLMRLVETLWKKCVLDDIYSVFTKITYILSFPHHLFGAISQKYLRCCLPGCSPHFAPNKTNSQLSCCAFSLVDICKAWFMSSEGILLFSSLVYICMTGEKAGKSKDGAERDDLTGRIYLPFLHMCFGAEKLNKLIICINSCLYIVWGFPGSSAGKESTCNVGDLGSIPW